VLLDITEELFVSNGFSVFIKRVNQRHLVHRVLSIIEEALVKQQQQKKHGKPSTYCCTVFQTYQS
jgi:hypothetical protein